MFLHVSTACSSFLNAMPYCTEVLTVCLSIYLLMDIWVVFKTVGIFWKVELKEFVGGEAVTYYRKGRVTEGIQILHFK